MDDLRFRKIFNLGITKDISGKKLTKLEKLQSWLRNVVEYGKYSSAKLANLYTFVSRAEIGNQFSYQFTHVIQKYTNLPTLKGYIFRILYCKARFPNRTLPKRAVFHCFLSARVELMTLTQKKILVRYVTMKWKTGLIDKWFE